MKSIAVCALGLINKTGMKYTDHARMHFNNGDNSSLKNIFISFIETKKIDPNFIKNVR